MASLWAMVVPGRSLELEGSRLTAPTHETIGKDINQFLRSKNCHASEYVVWDDLINGQTTTALRFSTEQERNQAIIMGAVAYQLHGMDSATYSFFEKANKELVVKLDSHSSSQSGAGSSNVQSDLEAVQDRQRSSRELVDEVRNSESVIIPELQDDEVSAFEDLAATVRRMARARIRDLMRLAKAHGLDIRSEVGPTPPSSPLLPASSE